MNQPFTSLALIGATGLVGTEMRKVLEERFPNWHGTFIPVATAKHVGQHLKLNGRDWRIHSLEEALALAPQVALFSAGGAVSIEWAPRFAAAGTVVIDNSSAWRMHEEVPLVVPEINPDELQHHPNIIANPNCSTIQLVLALSRLHAAFGLTRLVVSTYQSVTGTGIKAVHQLENERQGISGDMAYAYRIDKNCIPQCDAFAEEGYTKEEWKVVNETRKILNAPQLRITCTAVRVPVVGGHSESVNAEFEKPITLQEVRHILAETPGVVVYDHPETQLYPMPANAKGHDAVFVGRLRLDQGQPNTLNLWIVADNLRKGAATNAVQIAQLLVEMGRFGG